MLEVLAIVVGFIGGLVGGWYLHRRYAAKLEADLAKVEAVVKGG